MMPVECLNKLHTIDREYHHLEKAAAILRWDQETYLPEKAVEERAEQLSLLEGIAHQKLCSSGAEQALLELGSTPENPPGDESLPALERDFLKVFRRIHDRAVKLPGDFVSEVTRAEGLSQAAWARARTQNDFQAFLPHLEKMIGFSRQKAFYWGFSEKPYDGLLDIYESGMGEEEIGRVFTPLREKLKSLIRKIERQGQPDNSFLDKEFDIENQENFCKCLLEYIGFDSLRGRLDVSAHPFTTTLGSNDVRITTRYQNRNLQSGIFSAIHEAGHAFYEMGFPDEIKGSCLADGASMGIHESQSRLWENVIGRSRAFWEGMFPALRSYFPGALSAFSAGDFFKAINLVEPSLIRVEADEVSYSLHIILRFELEKELISGALDPSLLPAAWRSRMKEFLGVEPETDSEGVLQDVHWSMGAFGYFPSYALGNLYGLQFWEKLKSEISNTDELIAAGDFSSIKNWLRDTIYIRGRREEPQDLIKIITGKTLSPEPFLSYIESKYAGISGF